MSNLFICAHTAKLESKVIIDELISQNAIGNWCYNMRGTFFCSSDLSVDELSTILVDRFGNVRHVFIDITDSAKKGRLPAEHWKMILKKGGK